MLDEFLTTLDHELRTLICDHDELETYEILPSNMRSFAETARSFREAIDWAIFKMCLDDGVTIKWIDTDRDEGDHLGPGPFRRWESLDVTVQFSDKNFVIVRRIRQC